MIEDAELLRRYAEERSEPAFAELVQRHLGLVYGVALRKVGGDAHLAQDVAQNVFADLARKAAPLSRRAVLTGWLFTSTQFAAAKAVRTAQRWRAREREAQLMHETSSDDASGIDWEKLRPVLDDSIGELDARDREAVLLRFFQGRDFAHVGAKLNLTAEGARSRVDRAVEKIHASLARRGITSTAAAVSLALANQAAATVPSRLAAHVTSFALAGATSGGASSLLVFMSTNKLALGILGALVIAGSVTLVKQQLSAGRMQLEIAGLRQQVPDLAVLRAENQHLLQTTRETEAARSAQAGELSQLRNEMTTLKSNEARARAADRAGNAPPSGAAAEAASRTALQPGMLPVESWNNVGHATPEAAFQTELWASVGGNTELAAKLITFDAASRAKAQALFASLTESGRAQFGSPEQMAANFMASATPFAGMQVLSATARGPDEVMLDTQWQYTDGRVRQNQWEFHRDANGNWQWVVPAALVDKMTGALTGRPPPAATAGK